MGAELMPFSAEEGKLWTVERIAALNPATVLDIGAGAGIYARMVRTACPDSRIIGIEVFEPYVENFALEELYDELWIGDVRTFYDFPFMVDVVILGDVLEHLDHDDALELWSIARIWAQKGVFLSLPIYGYEQGPEFGNEHEAHLHQWTNESVRAELDGIIDGKCWSIVGTYVAEPA